MTQRKLFGLILILLTLTGITVSAQTATTCPVLVESAIETANENCTEMGRNEACYGYRSITASFYDDAAASDFSEPTDRVPVTDIRRIESLPANPDTGEIGVALMKIQAMLPNTLPGQNVVFVLVGDVQIESAVAPAEAASPSDPITLTLASDADARSGAGEDFNALAAVTAGTTLDADGVSADGAWVRVILEDYLLWIPTEAFEAVPDDLPAVMGGSYGAMQAFTLSTGVGTPQCEDAPSSLMVQGPGTTEITLNVNGADVTIGSTVVFEATSENELEIAVIDGSARLNDDDQLVLGGFRARVPLDPQTRRVVGRWNATEEIPEARLARISEYRRVGERVLNYGIEPPTRAEIREQVDAGLLERQNNFGILSPEQREGLLPFESRLGAGVLGIERPGIRPRIGDRILPGLPGRPGVPGNADDEARGGAGVIGRLGADGTVLPVRPAIAGRLEDRVSGSEAGESVEGGFAAVPRGNIVGERPTSLAGGFTINSDGTVFNDSGEIVGTITRDGTLLRTDGSIIGTVDDSGTITRDDGTIIDSTQSSPTLFDRDDLLDSDDGGRLTGDDGGEPTRTDDGGGDDSSNIIDDSGDIQINPFGGRGEEEESPTRGG